MTETSGSKPIGPENGGSLFPEMSPAPQGRKITTGVLPMQDIRALIREQIIRASVDITDEQLQPASMDLRLGTVAYRVRASFLPGAAATVMDKTADHAMHEIDLSRGAVLEKGCVYIVPLLESLHLARGDSGMANPKSSTGRLDVFTRLITDHATEFDRVTAGYRGPLYAEISPRTFSILVHTGTRLNQLRLRRGAPVIGDAALRALQEKLRLVQSEGALDNISKGKIAISVDLRGDGGDGLVGYRAKKHAELIDMDKINHYDPLDYWDPIHARKGRGIILDPDDFYILASREPITVPPDLAAEMVAYDTLVGEFRVHYAGFFDPGFGYFGDGKPGTRAVLEVRSHEV
ncbi:MAG: 2'-deoxycytidine 5'-triphosphate deaminase, partial [Alphaproteobacteria bacterium]